MDDHTLPRGVCLEPSLESQLQGWKDRSANYEDRIAELEAENEHLKALLAATQKALIIEPGKTYVIEAPDGATAEQIEHLGQTWRDKTCSHAVILADGWRVARERVDL